MSLESLLCFLECFGGVVLFCSFIPCLLFDYCSKDFEGIWFWLVRFCEEVLFLLLLVCIVLLPS